MEIILLHDVPKLGRRGEKVNVARGHARNFLFPQGLAVRADTANMKDLEAQITRFETQDEKGREAAEALAAAMQDAAVTITAAAGEESLYGSVGRGDDRRGAGGPGARGHGQAGRAGGAAQEAGHLHRAGSDPP